MSLPSTEQQAWISTKVRVPPESELVDTKIDDERGVRNVQHLTRRGRLWFSAGMYVYYTPTHWRPLT